MKLTRRQVIAITGVTFAVVAIAVTAMFLRRWSRGVPSKVVYVGFASTSAPTSWDPSLQVPAGSWVRLRVVMTESIAKDEPGQVFELLEPNPREAFPAGQTYTVKELAAYTETFMVFQTDSAFNASQLPAEVTTGVVRKKYGPEPGDLAKGDQAKFTLIAPRVAPNP